MRLFAYVNIHRLAVDGTKQHHNMMALAAIVHSYNDFVFCLCWDVDALKLLVIFLIHTTKLST
jgi:hypothetical protein